MRTGHLRKLITLSAEPKVKTAIPLTQCCFKKRCDKIGIQAVDGAIAQAPLGQRHTPFSHPPNSTGRIKPPAPEPPTTKFPRPPSGFPKLHWFTRMVGRSNTMGKMEHPRISQGLRFCTLNSLHFYPCDVYKSAMGSENVTQLPWKSVEENLKKSLRKLRHYEARRPKLVHASKSIVQSLHRTQNDTRIALASATLTSPGSR